MPFGLPGILSKAASRFPPSVMRPSGFTSQELAGREITGWKSSLQDIKNAGAQLIDQEVVEGNNLISGSSEPDIPALVTACLKKTG